MANSHYYLDHALCHVTEDHVHLLCYRKHLVIKRFAVHPDSVGNLLTHWPIKLYLSRQLPFCSSEG